MGRGKRVQSCGCGSAEERQQRGGGYGGRVNGRACLLCKHGVEGAADGGSNRGHPPPPPLRERTVHGGQHGRVCGGRAGTFVWAQGGVAREGGERSRPLWLPMRPPVCAGPCASRDLASVSRLARENVSGAGIAVICVRASQSSRAERRGTYIGAVQHSTPSVTRCVHERSRALL